MAGELRGQSGGWGRWVLGRGQSWAGGRSCTAAVQRCWCGRADLLRVTSTSCRAVTRATGLQGPTLLTVTPSSSFPWALRLG